MQVLDRALLEQVVLNLVTNARVGGQIQVASELGRGTKFDVLLPRAPRGGGRSAAS